MTDQTITHTKVLQKSDSFPTEKIVKAKEFSL